MVPVMLISGSLPQRTSEEELLWDWDGVDSIRKFGYAVDVGGEDLKVFKHCVYDQAFSPPNKLTNVSPPSIRYSKKEEREERTIT